MFMIIGEMSYFSSSFRILIITDNDLICLGILADLSSRKNNIDTLNYKTLHH